MCLIKRKHAIPMVRWTD